MPQDSTEGRKTVSLEELAYSNMMIVQALVELLAEKGVVHPSEIMDRVRKLRESGETIRDQHSPSTLNAPEHNHTCVRCRGAFPCWEADCSLEQEFVCDDCADDFTEEQTH
jgi:hypothetical protein